MYILIVGFLELIVLGELMEPFSIDPYDYKSVRQEGYILFKLLHILIFRISHKLY